ncbi:hypothetical protein CEXT_180741 [Caerostris extrusa]|uniref:Uncharacterized protein n=1 Tax=Caerostris extrusa TaxID=172846 RepID=A0AAV4MC99_CAEEX|nr:hypothetical protein CEXT_180741 [Caerostris extrusa]
MGLLSDAECQRRLLDPVPLPKESIGRQPTCLFVVSRKKKKEGGIGAKTVVPTPSPSPPRKVTREGGRGRAKRTSAACPRKRKETIRK